MQGSEGGCSQRGHFTVAQYVKTDRSADPAGSGIVLFSTARIVCHSNKEIVKRFKHEFFVSATNWSEVMHLSAKMSVESLLSKLEIHYSQILEKLKVF